MYLAKRRKFISPSMPQRCFDDLEAAEEILLLGSTENLKKEETFFERGGV
jgi:hypothetical protein